MLGIDRHKGSNVAAFLPRVTQYRLQPTMAKQLALICALLAALTALFFRPDVLMDVRSLLLRTSGSTDDTEEPYNGVTSSDVKVLSYDPFIAHVSNLVSPAEREYLIQLS